jgi:hypothetical protein
MPEALPAVTEPSLAKAGRSLRRCRAWRRGGYTHRLRRPLALAALDDGHRGDLVLEFAGLLGGLRLVLGSDGEFVLLVAVDLPLLGDVLGGLAHVVAVEGVPQAVLDHGVDHLVVAHLVAGAHVGAMRRQRHVLLAAGHHDGAVAGQDLLRRDGDGPEARAADLVEGPGGGAVGDAGLDGGLARRVLALARGQHLAEDDLVDVAAVDAGLFHGRLHHDGAQIMGRRIGK